MLQPAFSLFDETFLSWWHKVFAPAGPQLCFRSSSSFLRIIVGFYQCTVTDFMSPGLNCACVNSSSHFNHSSYCVLFYLIVLYGCVCQPLINGYDDNSVVRTLVSGQQTFPALRQIYG